MEEMALFWRSVVSLATIASSMAIFIGGEQDVGSPLRVAQCRATCLERFSYDGPNGESMCLQGPDCFMCWENCELLQSNYQVWGAMCNEKELCFPGCQESCRFHAEASTQIQQTQPVIHTKGEGVIQVSGGFARWPRPSSVDPKTPLVYVVMIKSQGGVWRQIIQTLDLTTRVPLSSDKRGTMLRVLVVDPQGLITIYSPDEASLKENKKRKKTINTEIRATTSKSTSIDSPWALKEVSLIHQKVLVIGEIAWEPKATRGVYLVTWEVDGGGLKGNLFTDSTCVTLSLWPDTIYHIQVELVSRTPGVENLKSEMMDLDTGRAQKVSTESQEDLNILSGGSSGGVGDNGDNSDIPEDVDFNSPLLSVLVSAVRGENTRHKWYNIELVLGSCAAILVFALLLALILWRCRRRHGMVFDNMITGSTSIRSQKLIEDFSGYTGFQPIISVMSTNDTKYYDGNDETTTTTRVTTPEVTFQGAQRNSSNFFSENDKTARQEVQV